MSDEIITRLVEDSIVAQISEKDRQAIIKKHIQDKLHYRDISDVIDDTLKIIVKREVITYINEHPDVFNEVPKMIDDAFAEEMKDLHGIRGLVKRNIANATIRYYLESKMDRLV